MKRRGGSSSTSASPNASRDERGCARSGGYPNNRKRRRRTGGNCNGFGCGGPPGGLGYDIRYDFDNPDTWYVTDANAGVHISYDNGFNLAQSNSGINTVGGPSGDGVPVFSLTIDPHDADTIWIGTTSGEIYRSTDGGISWVQRDEGIDKRPDVITKFRGFTVDPRSSDIVYAMAELLAPNAEDPTIVQTGGVVYQTTDGGGHWTVLWNGGLPSSLARYLWIDRVIQMFCLSLPGSLTAARWVRLTQIPTLIHSAVWGC